MLRLLLGTDWVTVRETILNEIAEDVQAQKSGRILMVPELISHDTERRLCAAAGDTASRYAEVLSFSRLARRVAEYEGCAMPECMDAGGRVVAMAAAARQVHSKLKAYASVQTKPEFLTALVEMVDEFKRCCISERDLAEASGQTQGSLAQKLEELGLLLGAYDGLCAQGKRDPRDLMSWLLDRLFDGEFGENHVFYIDGFPDFTRQHLAILEYLIKVSPNVTVGLNCDRVDSASMAFEKAADTAAQLLRCAKHAGVEVNIQILPPKNMPLETICAGLFQGPVSKCEQEGCLTVFRAESAFHEVQAVADKILKLVRSGCRYRDISVVCTDMPGYAGLLRHWFHRCGIPVYESGTEDVLQRNVLTTVLSAMDAVLGEFDRPQVLRYLRSALSPLTQEQYDRVENYAILWGIRGKRWLENWENHPDGLGQIWTDAARQQLRQLNEARVLAIQPLEELSQSFRQAKNLRQQVQGLYAFLERIDFARRLDDLSREMEHCGDSRSAQILDQLWEILLGALEQLYDVLGDTVWESEAFSRLVVLLLSQYDVGTIPPVLDAVMVGPVSAMRCQQEKHLFVLGAQEGLLPGYGGSIGILTDQERGALRDLGVPLTGGALEGLQAEFAEVYGVFCGGRESITVSCPEGQPSYVYRRLAQMAGKEEVPEKLLCGPETVDMQEAGIFLNCWGARDTARELGLLSWYQQAQMQTQYTLGSVQKERIAGLYGEVLNLSASQIDRQAECRFSYFLRYGMRAKERKEAAIDPAEFGTYVHAVLEHTAKQVMALGGFGQVSLEQTMEIAMSFSEEYTKQRFSELDSQRMIYLFRRNRQELELVVAELWQELKQSKFLPMGFEVAFGGDGALPPISVTGEKMSALIRGFVDRVDLWRDGGKNYFRVVDYKTGKKDFDYCDVFNGVGLQMLLYLFALEKGDFLGEKPIGAGVQYFPARVPIVSADGKLSDEEAAVARRKEWKRKGLLLRDEQVLQAMDSEDFARLCCSRKKDGTISGDLADRQQMNMLEEYLFRYLSSMVDEIASGNVQPNPYTRGTAHNACNYCPYDGVCHSKTVTSRRNYQAMSPQRFWEEIGKEAGHV